MKLIRKVKQIQGTDRQTDVSVQMEFDTIGLCAVVVEMSDVFDCVIVQQNDVTASRDVRRK